MNKQELIKKYKRLEGVWDAPGAETARQIFLQDLEQLDEPEKVKVPQFVADWYEKHKDDLEYDIWEYILHWGKQQKSEFYEWMNHANNKPFQTLVNMHQFGYEVEKKKRYLVKMKNIDINSAYLKHQLQNNHWYWGTITECGAFSPYHTKKELEANDFGWVFDCDVVEVEEVE
nr:MAG TPA: Protein of unknown function (DUF1642) [Caudoviricetes sp.]